MSSNKTPVTVLQEYLLKRNVTAAYNLIYNGVGTHEPLFKYEVIAGGQTAIGTGKSKKEAKHEAAKLILEKLMNEGEDFREFVEDTDSITSPYVDVLKENAVGALQDFCAGNDLPMPKYELTRDEGLPHAKVFCIRCTVSSLSCQSTARTKKQAKQLAAQSMLNELKTYLSDVIPSDDVNSKDTLDGSCNLANDRIQDTGVKKMGGTTPLGLNIANYCEVFKEEDFPKSATLDEIKDRPPEWLKLHEEPHVLLERVAAELNCSFETGHFEPVELGDVNIWLTVNSTPPWSFFGSGSSETDAYSNACVEALHFFIEMFK